MVKVTKEAIPYVSLVISIITAIALIWSSYGTREHYRLVVKPMVLPDVISSSLDKKLGIYLKNEGAGPAKINFRGVVLDGRSSSILAVISQMKKEGVLIPPYKGARLNLSRGSYLREGGKKLILAFDPKSVEKSALNKFDRFVHHRIEIHYESCSVYKKCEPSCTALRCTKLQ